MILKNIVGVCLVFSSFVPVVYNPDELLREADRLFNINESREESPSMDESWNDMPLYRNGDSELPPFLFDYIERDKDKDEKINSDIRLLYIEDVEDLGLNYNRKIVI